MNQTLILIAGLLGAGGLSGVIGVLFGRRKTGAETTEIITQAAEGIVKRYDLDNTRLRTRVEKLERDVRLLKNQVRSFGVEPVVNGEPR